MYRKNNNIIISDSLIRCNALGPISVWLYT